MCGILFEGKKYIYRMKSDQIDYCYTIFDKLYIILGDLVMNVDCGNISILASEYLQDLKQDKSKVKLERLHKWMNIINSQWFEFNESNISENKKYEEDEYILFDIWWTEYKNICDELKNHIATM
jgi:hypothetical protein